MPSAGTGIRVASLQLKGEAALVAKLKTLPAKVRVNVVLKAMRKAAKPVQKRAMALTPAETGELRGSIKIRSRRARKGRSTATVEVVTGAGFFTGDVYYGGFVHYGHDIVVGKHKRVIGEAAPIPFLEDAIKQTKGKALRIAKQALGKGIRREAIKKVLTSFSLNELAVSGS